MQASTSAYQIKFKPEDFIRKGVVDLQRYYSSKTKIMLVLKGIIPSTNENLNEYFGDEIELSSYHNALNRLAFICWSIQNGFSSWMEFVKKRNFLEARQSLHSVAFVSVPKFRDCSVYRKVAVREKYERLTATLNDHIEIYEPDIIMFCGTFDLFKSNLTVAADEANLTKRIPYAFGKKRIYINAPDPEVRSSDLRYYEGIRVALDGFILCR